jgi:hypothetical protein
VSFFVCPASRRQQSIAYQIWQSIAIQSVKSIAPEEVQAFFGWLAIFAGRDMPASSAQTQRKLGRRPTGPGLIADLERLQVAGA